MAKSTAIEKLENGIALIREAFAEEYQRARQAATAQLRETLATLDKELELTSQRIDRLEAHHARPSRTVGRASRGAPEAFVRRVLSSRGRGHYDGIAPLEIKALAETDEEKRVSYSAIRFALGNAAKAGWARNVGRKWVFVDENEAGLRSIIQEEKN